MPEATSFGSIDALCQQARANFRTHSSRKQKEIDMVLTLCFEVVSSISKLKTPDEWKDSREEATLAVLFQSIETVLAMHYLSESGFWDNALVLKRNFSELLLIAIAIGFDQQCFIDWKHGRANFDSFERIYKRVEQSSNVPEIEKSLLPHLKRYWSESSQLFSHNMSRKSIRTFVKDGQIHFEPKSASADFQEKRMNTIRNMLLDVISILLGIFQYDKRTFERRADFPEAPGIISRCNECFQNHVWKSEKTT